MHRKLYIIVCFLLLGVAGAFAQIRWYNPMDTVISSRLVHGQGWHEDGGNYFRLPLRAKEKVRKEVWNLACQSAGLSLSFRTNASDIRVRYKVTGGHSMPHMPSTGVSGVDLYCMDDGGKMDFCFGSYSFADTIQYTYRVETDKSSLVNKDYILYLPLYNGVQWLEIGVPDNSVLTFIPKSDKKSIVLYGTSIAQGACASRPGMAWGNILGRLLHVPVINLGFSGNGKLETEVLDFVNEQEAIFYIFDCMANLSECSADEVCGLVKKAVRQIRMKNKTPILLIEHAGYSNACTDKRFYMAYTEPNRGQYRAYEELRNEGVKDLYYLSNAELGFNPDSWVDYVHPSDWGMVQQAEVVKKKILEIK